jgi:hypothetical protein
MTGGDERCPSRSVGWVLVLWTESARNARFDGRDAAAICLPHCHHLTDADGLVGF